MAATIAAPAVVQGTTALPQFKILSADGQECNPKAMVADIQNCRLPRYVFPDDSDQHNERYAAAERVVDATDDSDVSSRSSEEEEAEASGQSIRAKQVVAQGLLDSMILALWDEKFAQGLFRYDVTACPTKIVKGSYSYVAQLNEGRANKKRPTEFRVDQVLQPFDPSKFNFTKAFMQEVMFEFVPDAAATSAAIHPATPASPSPHLVVINVSPIDYGHILLCPRVLDGLPQLIDPSTLLLALQFATQANNPHMRMAYNSLGAYATVNHLHFQAYFLPVPYAIELAPTQPLDSTATSTPTSAPTSMPTNTPTSMPTSMPATSNTMLGSVRVQRLADYPVRGFVFESTGSLRDLADVVGAACVELQRRNQPHNLFISDKGRRLFLYPQCYAAKQARGEVPEELLATGVNPAVFEISGHQVMFRPQDYDGLSQDGVFRMLGEVSLQEGEFVELAAALFPSLFAPGSC